LGQLTYPTYQEIIDKGFTDAEAAFILSNIERFGGDPEIHWHHINTVRPDREAESKIDHTVNVLGMKVK